MPAIIHACLVFAGYALAFTWLFAEPIVKGRYLTESDLYEYYLPIFLAPITTWSSFEFSGLPAFADPGDFTSYPPHFLFARIIGSWTGFIVSALVMAACFTYAYVYRLTRSRTAAAFAGLAYGMSEAIVERLPHLGTMHCFAWLPLILLSLEELRGAHRLRWIAIGGVAVACAFLSGHPQPAVYTVYAALLYAVVGAIAQREPLSYYASVAAMCFVAGLLASIKAIPLVEASFLMARQVINFGQFAGHGNTPAQLLSAMFPTVLHEGREAPTYVGLSTLLFAFAGVSMLRRNWRIAFWTAAAIAALLITLGEATPFARLVFAIVPLYQKFRVGSRHLFLAAFGAAVLAGYAIAAVQRGDIRVGRLRASAAILLALMAGGAVLLAVYPSAFEYEVRRTLLPLPVWNTGVWVQFAIAAATVTTALLLAPGRRFAGVMAVMMAILFADNLYSLPYNVTMTGLVPITIPREAAAPSVHAVAIKRDLQPLRQRALAIGGTHVDAVIPAAFARLWQVPIAGGYGPMLLERFSEFALMGTNGSVRYSLFDSDDTALDIMAVRYLLVQDSDVAMPPTMQRDGIEWTANGLGIPIGRPDCGHPYARSISIPVPSDVDIAGVALVTHLRCDEDVEQGAEALRVRLAGNGVVTDDQILKAGIDTAEQELGDDALRRRAHHRIPENVFDDPPAAPALRFLSRITLPHAVKAQRLEIDAPATNGWVTIDRITLIDAAGKSHPLAVSNLWLADTARWRVVNRFETSRITDRGTDESAPGELPYTVVENRRALARAWVVSQVKALSDGDAMEAVRRSQFPDGTHFDPRTTALVDSDSGSQDQSFPAGAARVDVETIEDGHFTVRVSTAGGGFLVLSETYYPGWGALIDGVPAEVERADVAFQGVVIPSGTHTVEFRLASTTQRAGAAMSIAGLVLCAALLIIDFRRTSRALPANAG